MKKKNKFILILLPIFVLSTFFIFNFIDVSNTKATMEKFNNSNAGLQSLVNQGLAEQKEDGSIMLKEPKEKPEKRTHNSVTYLTGYTKDGREINKGRFYSGEINYYNESTEQYEPIDTSLSDHLDSWTMDKSEYKAVITANLKDNFLTFKNKDQEIFFSLPAYPKDKKITANKTIFDSNWSNKQAVYKDALGKDIDLAISLNNESLIKEAVINNIEALGDLTGKDYFEIPFKLAANKKIDLKIGDKFLSKAGTITSNEMAQIIDEDGVTSYIWQPKAEDGSVKIKNIINIQIEYKLNNDGTITLTKKLPVEWLKSAAYPIRTDATISYFADSGDGMVRYDVTPSSWNTGVNATNGTYAFYNTLNFANAISYYKASTNRVDIDRAFIPIDTSSLSETIAISSSTLYLFGDDFRSYWAESGDSYDKFAIIQTSQISTSSLITSDYDNCGDAAVNPTLGSNEYNNSSFTQSYNGITLNSTGLSWISKTGFTMLGIREAHDYTNHSSRDDKNDGISFFTSYYSGTDHDPYLEITYAYVPSAPTNLKVEGQTNPTKVTDVFPEFYATYNESGEITDAIYYKIQISNSDTNWNNLIWDSGTTSMAATSNGQRSPDITYNGSTPLLFDGSTYYWRIKFWDSNGGEGAWSSGNDYFTMASAVGLMFP